MSNKIFETAMTYFLRISAIPRGSGNEGAIAAYLENFAKERGLFCIRDEWNNVFIRRPADVGYEAAQPVVLQGHTDMVCEANVGVVHDFLTDPIRVIREGDILHADGTTLGADNGVAVALMLALLEQEALHAPTLECLFTTAEETGLDGMRHFDASVVTGRRMLNLDSAGEGEATAACAGGVRTDLTKPVAREPFPAGYTPIEVVISGLAGGHSGEDIHKGRLPAIYAMGLTLSRLAAKTDIRLCSLTGGSKDNAIPRECTAVIAVSDMAALRKVLRETSDFLTSSLVPEDKDFALTIKGYQGNHGPAEAITKADTDTVLSLVQILPIGVRRMSRDIPDLVETSANLGIIRTYADRMELTVSSRSSVEARIDEMQSILEACARLSGATFVHRSRYPGWAFTTGSTLQQCYLDTWQRLYGTPAKIIGIHAGLECGLFMEKIPDMDIISIGPDIRDLHSPDEILTVSSFERFCALVVEMLAAMA